MPPLPARDLPRRRGDSSTRTGRPMDEQTERYLSVARQAALQAGELIRRKAGTSFQVDHKGRINLVTEVDTACEALIRHALLEAFPEHRILGEEGGPTGGSHACRWLVDPLDGTTNFAQGYPFYAVSIGLEIAGEMAVGVVHDPTRQETFHAVRGGGAWMNGQPIRVTDCEKLQQALLVTGFPYDLSLAPDLHLDLFRDFVLAARGVRRDGAAALDLCYVACGRFDAYWELGLSPWDMAAGSLILREAGGMLSDFEGRVLSLEGRDMLASNGRLHPAMLEGIRPHLPALRTSCYRKS